MKSMRKSILYNFFIHESAILMRNAWHISNHPPLFSEICEKCKVLIIKNVRFYTYPLTALEHCFNVTNP